MDLATLQERIGYKFGNLALLKEAMTHRSFAAERGLKYDNQRLEFLGDAVVQIILSEGLYRNFPSFSEGELTKRRAVLARESVLAGFARQYDLGRDLQLGRGEKDSGGADRNSMLCDLYEAVVGAIYLDGGWSAVTPYVEASVIHAYPQWEVEDDRNPKGALQEWVQGHGGGAIEYALLESGGVDHLPFYRVEVRIRGESYGEGMGNRRKVAEAEAAGVALDRIRKTDSEVPS